MDELAKRFAELAEKYGPQVAEAAKEAARTEAYSCLSSSAIWLAIACVLMFVGRRIYNKGKQNHDPLGDGDVLCIIGFALCGLAVPAVLIGAWHWIDPWTWTTINHPELWIAKKAFRI